MKRLTALGFSFLLLLAVTGCTAAPAVAPAEPKVITVSGEGAATGTPDIVKIDIGVEAQGDTASAARQKGNVAINATIEAIKALGVPEEDILTSSFRLRTFYNNNGYEDGYRMSTTLTVTVRDFEVASKVIDASIDMGSNTMGNIQYLLSNEVALYNQALEAAVKTARTKAELLAAAQGKTVTEVQSITELGTGAIEYTNPATGGGGMANDTALMAGTSSINARVSASFLIQ